MMRFYSLFGGCLATTTEFPELRETTPCEPRWFFRVAARLPDRDDLVEIGAQHIYGDVYARLFRHARGRRIIVDDTGKFDIDEDGTSVVCEEKEGAWPDFVRAHLLGRVLSTALFSRGLMPLHGSAVQMESGVVGLLAPKKFGKSTLALALTRSGARLVTDDTLPVELSNPVRAWPGIHSVRVSADSLAAVGIQSADFPTREGKGVVTSLADHQLASRPAPLTALYLLQPVIRENEVTRELLPSVSAAVALVANFKLAKMTGPDEMGEVLRRAALIAECVPVYRLFIPRDLGQLDVVSERVLQWHGQVPAVAEGFDD